jgi:hypothetical protein
MKAVVEAAKQGGATVMVDVNWVSEWMQCIEEHFHTGQAGLRFVLALHQSDHLGSGRGTMGDTN